MYRLCIFDLDGTLADTVESMAYSANLALKELGLPKQPAEAFRYFAGDGARELVRRCLEAAGDDQCHYFERMYALYRTYFGEHCMYHVEPYPGIRTLLEKLKGAGVRTAVLSNKPHAQAVKVVERIFGDGCFDYIQGQKEGIPRKPDPAGAMSVAARFGVSPSECLYIGDTNTDMQTGRAAGMFTVGVLWGFRDRKELEDNQASVIVHSPQEIWRFILESDELKSEWTLDSEDEEMEALSDD